MAGCNTVNHPLDTKNQLRKFQDGDVITDATLYQQIIGSLMYLVTGTRPDLAFTISKLAQFNSKPTIAQSHDTRVSGKRVRLPILFSMSQDNSGGTYI